MRDRVQELAGRAVDAGGEAVTALAPRAEDALAAAVLAYDEARERLRDDVVPKVRDEYVPLVRDEYAPRMRAQVQDRYRKDVVPRARAAAASPVVARALAKSPIDLPVPRKRTHRVRNTVLALGVGGGVAYAVNRLRSGSTGDTSYTPPPRPTAVPDPAPTSDQADTGLSGDEVIVDHADDGDAPKQPETQRLS